MTAGLTRPRPTDRQTRPAYLEEEMEFAVGDPQSMQPPACGRFTYLASVGPDRAAAMCEHRTVHLVWDYAVLQLTPPELFDAAALVDSVLGGGGYHHLGSLRLIADADGGIQVWARRRGILIGRDDLADLARLVRQAGAVAAGLPDQGRRFAPFPPFHPSAMGRN